MKKKAPLAHRENWFRREPAALANRSLSRLVTTLFPLILFVAISIASLPIFANGQDQAPSSDSVAPPTSQQSSAAPAESPAPAHRHSSSRSSYDDHLSKDLNDYLHTHHLPFVDAMVFSSASGNPTLVKLSGQVRSDHGKEDAATKSSDFLNQPGIRVQNRIDVNASLDSTAPAASSAPAQPASTDASAPPADAAVASNDPCSDLCYKDEGHCNTTCKSQAAGGATGGGFSVQAVLGQFSQSATQLQQCTNQCVQTREHCVYDCRQSSNSGSDSGDSGASREDASDHGGSDHAEGPNTPPE